MNIGEWVSEGLHSFKPSQEFSFQALRHLTKKKKENLFAQSNWVKRIAIGEWYEAIIYEKLLQLSRTDNDYSVVGKGGDVPWRNRVKPRLGQNGLFYDMTGSIVARGNGQDLSEFDLLLTKLHNEYAFLEIKNSSHFLKDFNLNLKYKKRLLSYLLSKPVQCGIVVSSTKIGNKSVIKRITATTDSFLIITDEMDELASSVNPEDLHGRHNRRNVGFRPMRLSKIAITGYNYRRLHNAYRKKFIKAVKSEKKPKLEGNFWMLKNVIVGNLEESAIIHLLNEKDIIFQGEKLTPENFSQKFSKVILSMSMPELRPVLYLRVQSKRLYLKMGPSTTKTFEFERRVYAKYTVFFDWLDSAESKIGPDLTKRILCICLNESVAGKRKKLGERENFS